MAERHPSRTLLLVPHPERDGRPRRAGVGALLPARRPRDLRRGDRVDAARRARGGAGVDRAAAPDLGPAGVLPLARPAGVGRRRRSSSCRRRSTGWSSTRRSGRTCRRTTRISRRSSTGSRCRTSRGTARSGGAGLLASLWPGIADVKSMRVHGTRAQAHLLRGWLVSRLGHDVELELDERERLEGIDLDGKPAPFPPGQAAESRATSSRRSSTASPATACTKRPRAPPRASEPLRPAQRQLRDLLARSDNNIAPRCETDTGARRRVGHAHCERVQHVSHRGASARSTTSTRTPSTTCRSSATTWTECASSSSWTRRSSEASGGSSSTR